MAFKQKTWTDRVSEYPTRRILTKEDGSTEVVSVARAEGEISKEVFKLKVAEIEPKITKLKEDITRLEAEQNAKPEVVDYHEKLTVLQYALEQYTNFDDGDVPESVIEAFVVKIVASQDGFDWYLRFDGDPNRPLRCTTQGKRKNSTKVSVEEPLSPAMDNSTTGCNQGI